MSEMNDQEAPTSQTKPAILNNFLPTLSTMITPNAADTKPWSLTGCYLKCRDVDGTSVIITPTATGLGAHTRWIYPEHDEEENAMDIDEEGKTIKDCLATPPTTLRHFPATPVAQHTFNAGSVIRTPAKKTKPLQRIPERVGFNGIDFWHNTLLGEQSFEQTANGLSFRYVIGRPVGSATNLSKDQLLELDFQRNQATFLRQVEKLLGREERDKVTREINQYLSPDKPTAPHGITHFGSPQPTIIIEDEENLSSKPNNAENAKHLGSVTIEGKEWQVYKTLRPHKDGQPRVIMSSPAERKTRRARA